MTRIAENGWDYPPHRDPRQRRLEAQIAHQLISAESEQQALNLFLLRAHELSLPTYWQILSSLWVLWGTLGDGEQSDGNYDGWARLFLRTKAQRKHIMKPFERRAYRKLPMNITAYRAMMPGQKRIFNFTTVRDVAERFASGREEAYVQAFEIYKRDVIALLLRRQEGEIIAFGSAQPIDE